VRCTRGAIGAAFPRSIWHAETPIVRTAPTPLMLLAERVRAEDAGHGELFSMNDEPDPSLELPNLTPQAARAIAAAAQAHTDAERDAALAMATGPDDEPLDRDLLLRFLSSVKR